MYGLSELMSLYSNIQVGFSDRVFVSNAYTLFSTFPPSAVVPVATIAVFSEIAGEFSTAFSGTSIWATVVVSEPSFPGETVASYAYSVLPSKEAMYRIPSLITGFRYPLPDLVVEYQYMSWLSASGPYPSEDRVLAEFCPNMGQSLIESITLASPFAMNTLCLSSTLSEKLNKSLHILSCVCQVMPQLLISGEADRSLVVKSALILISYSAGMESKYTGGEENPSSFPFRYVSSTKLSHPVSFSYKM